MRRGSSSAASSRARRRRLDACEIHDSTLHFRYHLLRDDHDIVRLEPAYVRSRSDEKRGEIVTPLELRNAAERDDANLSGQEIPVTRMPACAR
jgi:hypothetical protein